VSDHVAAAREGLIAIHDLDDTDALAQAVAGAVRQAVEEGTQRRGTASLVVTGGSTPALYYPRVAALPLSWERVWITLSDERWVGPDDADSNERLVRESLLRGPAAAARFVPLKTAAGDPRLGCAEAAQRLRQVPHPYDLVLLGVGADSHIASLFPGAPELDAALDPAFAQPCCAVTPPAGIKPALARLSLSFEELLDSRRIVIAARGADKRDALLRAAAGRWPQRSPLAELARRARQPVDFYGCPA
jgi:6-phosphogluconolactonase